MDAAGEMVAFLISAPKTGTLDWFEFRINAMATFPTNGIRLSFQSLSATGDGGGLGRPTETPVQWVDITSTPGGDTWVAPATPLTDSGGGGSGNKRAVTAGEFFACVIHPVNVADTQSINIAVADMDASASTRPTYPALALKNAGSWGTVNDYCNMALKYDDGTYPAIMGSVYPVKAFSAPAFGNASDPKERGLYFQFPVPVTVDGAWFMSDVDVNTELVLYDSNGTTELANISFDTNYRGSNGIRYQYFPFPAVDLAASTNYRLTLRPLSATITLPDIEVNAAGLLNAIEGGAAFHYTEKSAANAWTQTTNKRPFMGLRVSKIHDGSGGGGGNIFNVME